MLLLSFNCTSNSLISGTPLYLVCPSIATVFQAVFQGLEFDFLDIQAPTITYLSPGFLAVVLHILVLFYHLRGQTQMVLSYLTLKL